MPAAFSRSPSGMINLLVPTNISPSVFDMPNDRRSCEIARLVRRGLLFGRDGWPMGYERALSKSDWGKSVKLGNDLRDIDKPQDDTYWIDRESRPLVEIASWFLRSIAHRSIEVADLLVLSKLLGGSGVLRSHNVAAINQSNGTRVVYIPPSQIANKLSEFIEELNGFNPALSDFTYAATYFFLKLVSIHPFHDGNGRVAREMITLVMFKKFGDMQPLYPVEPVLRWQRATLHQGLYRWYLNSDMSYLHNMFEAIIVANANRCLNRKRRG